ncbi:hypothetical protein CDD80_266 [Ophiocordyceps camponoti-rufipedis]|uniref:ATP synthase subunit H, mitochondrial n=1 Tax=Ophiocordyceps camponoti-rufipedis TaxID=2004952 RepID=A0A2C5YKF2_9HYPO|nr:hypothetical protein CDD80_266 [Ophiocordyceps camponoti-rufipedis]
MDHGVVLMGVDAEGWGSEGCDEDVYGAHDIPTRFAIRPLIRAGGGEDSKTNALSLGEQTADFVQELYLKELKAYKTPPVKDSDAAGQVLPFSMPKTPASPEETDLAGSLKQYESMAVDVHGQPDGQAGAAAAVLPDWLEAENEDEEAHH